MTAADGVPVTWRSAICACVVHWASVDSARYYRPCCEEHWPWVLIVGSQEVRRKRLELEKLVRRGLPDAFWLTIWRFGASGQAASFHRALSVSQNDQALDAEMAFYLSESLGIQVTECRSPERLADYLANKATRGLTEKMWLEDWAKASSNLWPAELVMDDALTLEEADALFELHLDPAFVEGLREAVYDQDLGASEAPSEAHSQ